MQNKYDITGGMLPIRGHELGHSANGTKDFSEEHPKVDCSSELSYLQREFEKTRRRQRGCATSGSMMSL